MKWDQVYRPKIDGRLADDIAEEVIGMLPEFPAETIKNLIKDAMRSERQALMLASRKAITDAFKHMHFTVSPRREDLVVIGWIPWSNGDLGEAYIEISSIINLLSTCELGPESGTDKDGQEYGRAVAAKSFRRLAAECEARAAALDVATDQEGKESQDREWRTKYKWPEDVEDEDAPLEHIHHGTLLHRRSDLVEEIAQIDAEIGRRNAPRKDKR